MHEVEFMYVEHVSNRRNLFFCKSHANQHHDCDQQVVWDKGILVSDGKPN
jgi:hypothetical protein